MTFSTNLNRQLYVISSINASSHQSLNALGKAEIRKDVDGYSALYYKGYGGIVRSDLIPSVESGKILWANVTAPEDTAIKLKAFEIDFVTGGVKAGTTANTANAEPVSGQDYILRVNFNQMYGMSDEDIYQKFGAVHAVASMKKYDFFKAMAYSLVKNFSRLYQPLVDIAIGTGIDSTANYKIIDRATKSEDGTIHLYSGNTEINYTSGTDNTKLYILEKSQVDDWALGTKQYTPVYFKPFATTIQNGADEVVWGKVTDVTATYNKTVVNGYKYADLEYFCMGERGDQYRNVGWPKSIPTKYMVDPTSSYYAIDIHYAYQGDNHAVQQSEKTLTMLFKSTDKSSVERAISKFGLANIISAGEEFTAIVATPRSIIADEKISISTQQSVAVDDLFSIVTSGNNTGNVGLVLNISDPDSTGTTISSNGKTITTGSTAGDVEIEAFAYNANGEQLASKTLTLSVKQPNSYGFLGGV